MTLKLPPRHQWVETLDGSFTLFSEDYQESCHSQSGAVEETKTHYLQGCKVVEKLRQQETVTILEVGFGMGIGLLETIKLLKDFPAKKMHFISLEINLELILWFIETTDHPLLKKLEQKTLNGLHFFTTKDPQLEITILIGNARESLPLFHLSFAQHYDAIYQDAFSPKKNPELWTVEWFTLLKEKSWDQTHLATYSASQSIRKSLIRAGWAVSEGEKFGTKKSSTRATLSGDTTPELLKKLNDSPIEALYDQK